MVGLDNPLHIALVLIVVLMVFGAKRLPEMGKSMGAGLRGFKDSLQGNDAPEGLTAGPMLTAAVHEPVATVTSTPVATPVAVPVAMPDATPVAAQSMPPAA
jgi:sec-independent protein translocase protein TatA